MRNRIRQNDFTGGMNDLISPELLNENQCQTIENYEYNRSNLLTKRKDVITDSVYANILENIGVIDIYSYVVWYPRYKPEDCISDEIVFFIASTESGEVNANIIYKDSSNNYTQQMIGQGLLNFTIEATPTIFKSYDRLLIADWGSPQRPFELYYDKNSELIIRQLGIKSPNGIISLQNEDYYYGLPGDNSSIALIEVDNIIGDVGTGIEVGSTIQYVYTIIDKYGNESNPSPISTISYNMQKSLDAETTTGYKYFYKYLKIEGFILPDNISDIEEKSYINYKLYRRDIMYLEGSIIKEFELVANIPIGNTKFIDTGTYLGSGVSYENDIAPISKLILEKDKIIYLACTKTIINLPYNFDTITPIKLNNANDISYITPKIRIEGLNASNFGNSDWNVLLLNKDKIRIYFEDFITPCRVVYEIHSNSMQIDMIIELPYLYSSSSHRIYFCYDGEGVTDDYYKTFNYGLFIKSTTLSNIDSRFLSNTFKLKNNKIIAMSQMRTNNRDVEFTIEETPRYQIADYYPILYNNEKILQKANNIIQSDDAMILDTGLYKINKGSINISYFCGKINVSTSRVIAIKVNTYGIDDDFGTLHITVPIAYAGAHFSVAIYSDKYCLVRLSKIGQTTITYRILTFSYTTSGWFTGYDEVVDHRFIYSKYNTIDSTISLIDIYNVYIGGEEKPTYMSDEEYCLSFLNQETYFQYHNVGATKNLVIEDTLTEYDKGENTLRWSDRNSFPDLYYKKFQEPILAIIESPFYLSTEYGSSIIVYTRNTINRFLIKETVSSWADRADNVINEYSQNGLYAIKSLVRAGQSLIHYSEDGLIKWNKNGFINISKDIIDIPIKDSYNGVYVPLRNQYWLHDNDDLITFVYDLNRNLFIKFTGLNIKFNDTLDKGTTIGNNNLFITEEDGLFKFVEYPSTENYNENNKIITKKSYINNHKAIRLKIDYSGDTSNIVGTIYRNDKSVSTTYNNIDNSVFRGFIDGSYGDYISFEISEFDNLFAITYDLETKV